MEPTSIEVPLGGGVVLDQRADCSYLLVPFRASRVLLLTIVSASAFTEVASR